MTTRMIFAASVLLSPPLLAASGPAATTSVLIMPLQPEAGVSNDLCDLITDKLVVEASRFTKFHIVSFREVEGQMSLEQQRQLLSCDTASCAAEIAGALSTDEIVFGRVGRVGSLNVMTLSRVNARTALMAARAVEELPAGDESALLARVPHVAAKLFDGPVAQAPPGASAEGAPAPSWRRPVLLGLGGVALVGSIPLVVAFLGGAASAVAAVVIPYFVTHVPTPLGYPYRDYVFPAVSLLLAGAGIIALLMAGVLGVAGAAGVAAGAMQ